MIVGESSKRRSVQVRCHFRFEVLFLLADFFELIVRDLKPTKENPIKARELLPMLSTYFPAFNDCANYGGEKVFILKKAQVRIWKNSSFLTLQKKASCLRLVRLCGE